jgi:hypothetical protein
MNPVYRKIVHKAFGGLPPLSEFLRPLLTGPILDSNWARGDVEWGGSAALWTLRTVPFYWKCNAYDDCYVLAQLMYVLVYLTNRLNHQLHASGRLYGWKCPWTSSELEWRDCDLSCDEKRVALQSVADDWLDGAVAELQWGLFGQVKQLAHGLIKGRLGGIKDLADIVMWLLEEEEEDDETLHYLLRDDDEEEALVPPPR